MLDRARSVRRFTQFGHTVRMMALQFVKPTSSPIKMTPLMPKRFVKRCNGPACALCRPRVASSRIFKACTGYAVNWWLGVLRKPTRFAAYCWNTVSSWAKGLIKSESHCRRFLKTVRIRYRLCSGSYSQIWCMENQAASCF